MDERFFDGPAFDGDSRAKNNHRLHACGDPEQWGGAQSAAITIAAGGANPTQDAQSQQFIRTQARDLIAVPWDLLCTWTLQGLHQTAGNSDDTIFFALEITVGSGRTSTSFLFPLVIINAGSAVATIAQQNPAAGSNGLFPLPPNVAGDFTGIAQTFEPTPGVSMAVRVIISGSSTAPSHTVKGSAVVILSPRGYPL